MARESLGVDLSVDYAKLRDDVDRGKARKGRMWSAVHSAAQRGDVEAQYTLGYRWLRLYGAHYDKAYTWLCKAAGAGHVDAQKCLAEIEVERRRSRDALVAAAQSGLPQAQRDLGCLLATGDDALGVDLEQGRFWYEQAALQGHQDAQYNVGLMILFGEGGPADLERGLGWLERAATGTDEDAARDATYVLGCFYQDGLHGLPKNLERAQFWQQKNAQLGN